MKAATVSILNILFDRYPALSVCKDDIQRAYDLLFRAYKSGGKLLVCGNGGSASDAQHIVGELMKGFLKKRPAVASDVEKLKAYDSELGEYISKRLQMALPAIALTGLDALTTAFSNDVDPDLLFAQQVYGLSKPEDVVMGISTSGNSKNVVNAIYTAKCFSRATIGLTGRSGGKLANLCDVTIRVPADDTPTIQELHLPVYHALCAMIEQEFFDI